MAEQKIINFPEGMTALLFGAGCAAGFFSPEMLFSALGQIKGSLPDYMMNKLTNVRSMMGKNEIWAMLGGGLLVVTVVAFKKLIPLVVGIIVGFTARLVLINMGYSSPNLLNYMKGAI